MIRLIPWSEVKARMLASCSPAQRAAYARELNKARDRYRSDVRKFRGIDRIRRMYRRKWSRKSR